MIPSMPVSHCLNVVVVIGTASYKTRTLCFTHTVFVFRVA